MGALTSASHHRKLQSNKIRSITYYIIARQSSLSTLLPTLVLLSITVILHAQRAQTIESSSSDASSSSQSKISQQQITGNEDFTFSKNGSFLQIDAGREWPFNSKREISFRFKTKSPHGLLVYQTFDHNKLQREEDQENAELPTPVNAEQPNDIATTPIDLQAPAGKVPASRQQTTIGEPTKVSNLDRGMRRRRRRQASAAQLQQVTTTLEPEVRHLHSRTGVGTLDGRRSNSLAGPLSQLSSSTITATASEKLVNSLFSSSHISTINGNNPARNSIALMSNQPALFPRADSHVLMMATRGGGSGGGGGVTVTSGLSAGSRDVMATGGAMTGGGRSRLLNSLVATLNAAAAADAAESNVRVVNYGSSLRSAGKPGVESSDGSPVLSSSAINSLSASLYELYIKLENGRLKIVYEFGSRLNQTYCGKSLNDDRWHRVDLKVDPEINQMILTLDQMINVEIVLSQVGHEEDSARNRNELVFTNSILYLGGLNNNASIVKNVRQRLYMAQFIGCIGQILLKTDQSTEASLQPAPLDNMVYVKRGCLNLCDTRNYCLHKSTCLNYYTHTKCDCFGTNYEDVYCWQDKLTTLTMLGYSTMVYRIYDWRDRHHSNSNRFSLQFKTLARDSILFFAYGDLSTQQAMRNPINYSQSTTTTTTTSTTTTSNLVNLSGYPISASQVNISSLPTIHRPQQSHQISNNNNYLAISLMNGSLVVEISFGDQPVLLSNLLYDKIYHASLYAREEVSAARSARTGMLSDGQWHNVTLVHQGKQLTLHLDQYSVNYTLTGKSSHLYFDPSIYLGGVPNFLSNETRALLRPINLRYKFVGCLRSIYFNQQNVLLDLKQGSQMVEYRDLLGKPLLDVCEVNDPNSLPLTLRSGKSYLTFQLSPGPAQSSAALHSSVKTNGGEAGRPVARVNSTRQADKVTEPTSSSQQVSTGVTRKLTWIEFEYKTALTKHFLAGGHLRDLSYHDLGGFWTLQARDECSLYFTISSGLTFDPEQVLVLGSREKRCEPGQWYRVTISIMSGDKALNISRYPVQDSEQVHVSQSDHGSYTLGSSVELLHQVQIGGDLAKYGESSPIPFSGCVRRIIINGHSFDSRDFVTTQSSPAGSSATITSTNQQNMTMNQLAQVTQYDVISSRMAQGYVTIDSCRLVNPCATLNPCKNGGVCKITDLGEPDCDCSKTGYTGRRCHFSTYKKSCQDIYLSGQRKSSFYLIDLDRNGPLKPVRVRCNMESGFNNVETSLAHNLPAEYLIRRSPTSDILLDITYLAFHHMYTHDGFYVHDDSDEAARLQQDILLRALIGQSTYCKQHVRFECRSDPLNLGNRTWMEVPYPKRHKLLSLDGQSAGKCACASSEKRCLDASKSCNCDSNESIWSEDSHDLIGQDQVGLTRIVLLKHYFHEDDIQYNRISDATKLRNQPQNNLATVESQSRLSLGDLKCYGTRERGNQHEITFKTSDAYIEVPGWRRGDISFNFRTASNPPAIILYQLATSRNHGYFRLTLITDTRLLFEFIVNRRPRRLFLTASHRLNNGEWQQVFIEYDAANIRLTVNDDSVLVDLDPNDHLGTFEGPLFIGGAPSKYLVGDLTRRNGFTGCFKGLNINGRSIDLNDYLSSTMPTVISGCRPSCTKNLCQNGGKCIEYWGSYECECSNPIAHSGSNCEINLNTNSITFITPESHYVEQTSDTLTYPPYLIKSILLNIRTYQETALVLYAQDQFNNFIQLHKNGTSLVVTFNSNSTIVTARVPIVDETQLGSTPDSSSLPATSALGVISLAAQAEPQVTVLAQANNITQAATTGANLTNLNITTAQNSGAQASVQLLNATSGLHLAHFELDRSSIRSSNTSGSGQPIQIKIERHRLRTTFYVNNNFIVIEKPLILLTNYTQFPWLNPELELVRPIRPRSALPKSVSRIFLANIDEHFVTRIPGFAGCIQGFSIDNQLFDFNRAHLTGELKGDYKIGCKMHCDSFPCKNQGTCVENWIEDKIQCKCDTTSYVGRLCDEDIAAIFNGATSHLIYNLDRKAERLVPDAPPRGNSPLAPLQSAIAKSAKSNETTHAQSAVNATARLKSAPSSDEQRAVNFLDVSLAFSSETNHSMLVEPKSGVQVLVWVTFANSSKHFFLGLTTDGGLLIQEDYGNSMSLSRLIKKPDQLFNDGYRHVVKYTRFNQTIQIVVDHQAYLPTMSVIASSRMSKYSKASLISVGTPLNDPEVSKLIAREANPVEDDFVRYSGCISNLIMKMDGSIVEPLSEAFGQNLETVNVTTTLVQPSLANTAKSISTSSGRAPSTPDSQADGVSRTKSGVEPNDEFALTGMIGNDESLARARMLNVVDKESKQDARENMETIVARDVEQGKCASFKRVENSNEKRSVNEPKFTQLLDPRPAYMDPPRIKPYNRADGTGILPKSNKEFDFGPIFYCSLTFLMVIGGTLATYAYILQVRYKSEKFRCETPFFHNKRDELSGTPPKRTPTPRFEESSDDSS